MVPDKQGINEEKNRCTNELNLETKSKKKARVWHQTLSPKERFRRKVCR
jgi:hypothetical protein